MGTEEWWGRHPSPQGITRALALDAPPSHTEVRKEQKTVF